MCFPLQDLPKPVRANFILNVETDELFITAGLQDRVVQVCDITSFSPRLRHQSLIVSVCPQVYEGLVYMDFSKKLMEEQGYGTQLTQSLIRLTLLSFNIMALLRELRFHGDEQPSSVLAGLPERPQRLRTDPQQRPTALAQWYVLTSHCFLLVPFVAAMLDPSSPSSSSSSVNVIRSGSLSLTRRTSGRRRHEDFCWAHGSSQVNIDQKRTREHILRFCSRRWQWLID